MAKAVLISIRPEWVEKILAGEKTLEVRKTRPNMGTPFKCYIYCTNSGVAMGMWGKHGKVVGEFFCDKITRLTHVGFSGLLGIRLSAMKNGHTIDDSFDFSKSCLTTPQIEKYLGGKDGYAWHISDLKSTMTRNSSTGSNRGTGNANTTTWVLQFQIAGRAKIAL